MDSGAGDPSNPHYNDGNRAFLQAFLARGTLSFEEGKRILAAIFTVQEEQETSPDDVTQADFDSYISAAADAISPFDYEIRSTQHQITKERIYALVNSNSDALTQLATSRTTEEVLYVKRLLDAMFENYNTKRKEIMAITSMQALETKVRKGSGNRQSLEESTQSVDKGVTQEQAQRVLDSLMKEKWLERSKEGFYRLSPRGLMELRTWLVDAYNDADDPEEWQRIKFCEACKEIVTVGQRCADLDCNVRLHNICEGAYWNSRPEKKCPKCETEWNGKYFVGQKAETTSESYLKGKRRSAPGNGNKRNRPADNEDEESSGRRSRVAEPSFENEE